MRILAKNSSESVALMQRPQSCSWRNLKKVFVSVLTTEAWMPSLSKTDISCLWSLKPWIIWVKPESSPSWTLLLRSTDSVFEKVMKPWLHSVLISAFLSILSCLLAYATAQPLFRITSMTLCRNISMTSVLCTLMTFWSIVRLKLSMKFMSSVYCRSCVKSVCKQTSLSAPFCHGSGMWVLKVLLVLMLDKGSVALN